MWVSQRHLQCDESSALVELLENESDILTPSVCSGILSVKVKTWNDTTSCYFSVACYSHTGFSGKITRNVFSVSTCLPRSWVWRTKSFIT